MAGGVSNCKKQSNHMNKLNWFGGEGEGMLPDCIVKTDFSMFAIKQASGWTSRFQAQLIYFI